jgi:Glycosyl transferase family 2
MTVVGISMVKNEEDVIVPVIQHMLTQVDHVLVADNLSTDNTRILLEQMRYGSDRLTIVTDSEAAYFQSRKMTNLAKVAWQEFEADWIVPFDADEWWYAPDGRSIAEVLPETDEATIYSVPLYDFVPTVDTLYHADPFYRLQYRKPDAGYLPKVACTAKPSLVIEPGNHGAHFSEMHTVMGGALRIRHYPVRSPQQFVSKAKHGAAAYKVAGGAIPETYGAHWRRWGQVLESQGEEGLLSIYEQEHLHTDVTGLVFDPLGAA